MSFRKGITFRGTKILDELDIEHGQVTPPQIKCSFCGRVLQPHEATHGNGKAHVNREGELVNRPEKIAGPITRLPGANFDQKIYHTVRKVVACPDHVLMLVPITDSKGNILQQGTRFPPMEG